MRVIILVFLTFITFKSKADEKFKAEAQGQISTSTEDHWDISPSQKVLTPEGAIYLDKDRKEVYRTVNPSQSKCEFEDVGYSFIPNNHCKNELQVLDSLGCLNADGKMAKHCKKETWCHSKCASDSLKKYECHDFKICVEDVGSGIAPSKKGNSKESNSAR